jgi:ubiquitin-protein ligase E3 A
LSIFSAEQEELFLTEEKLNELITSCRKESNFKPLVCLLGEVFTKSSSLNISFPSPASRANNEESVDLDSAKKMFETLFSLQNSAVENTLINSLGTLSTGIEVELKSKSYVIDNKNYFKQFLIIFENPYLNQPEYLDNALPCFCKAVSLLPLNIQVRLVLEWSKHSKDSVKKKVEILQQLITFRVIDGPSANSNSITVNEDPVIAYATKCLKLFYYASHLGGKFDHFNSTEEPMDTEDSDEDDALAKRLELDLLDCRKPVLPSDEFINEPLNEAIAVDRDFTLYKTKEGFSFMECNFILTTHVKSVWMFYDNRVHMLQERRLTHIYSLLQGRQSTPYLKLTVHRDNLIQDALVNVSYSLRPSLL